jgi:ribosome-binding factor A
LLNLIPRFGSTGPPLRQRHPASPSMTSRRTLKAASAIREVVSMAILTELRDPRIENVTVTFVEISPDMRSAKVHVSVMGNEKQQQLCLHGLNRAAGFLQKRVSDRIDTRYTPRLQFVLDKGIKHSFKVAEILKEVLPPESEESAESSDGTDEAAPEFGDESSLSRDEAAAEQENNSDRPDDRVG